MRGHLCPCPVSPASQLLTHPALSDHAAHSSVWQAHSFIQQPRSSDWPTLAPTQPPDQTRPDQLAADFRHSPDECGVSGSTSRDTPQQPQQTTGDTSQPAPAAASHDRPTAAVRRAADSPENGTSCRGDDCRPSRGNLSPPCTRYFTPLCSIFQADVLDTSCRGNRVRQYLTSHERKHQSHHRLMVTVEWVAALRGVAGRHRGSRVTPRRPPHCAKAITRIMFRFAHLGDVHRLTDFRFTLPVPQSPSAPRSNAFETIRSRRSISR